MKSKIPLMMVTLVLSACDKSDEVKPLTSKVQSKPVSSDPAPVTADTAEPLSEIHNPKTREAFQKISNEELGAQILQNVAMRTDLLGMRHDMRTSKQRLLLTGKFSAEKAQACDSVQKTTDKAWRELNELRGKMEDALKKFGSSPEISLLFEEDDHLLKADKLSEEDLALTVAYVESPEGKEMPTNELKKQINAELDEAARLQKEFSAMREKRRAEGK
ncbi:MAG: hypothetical protein QM755_23205 [Luteolibacter sp.]